jgi:hypothetical protein
LRKRFFLLFLKNVRGGKRSGRGKKVKFIKIFYFIFLGEIEFFKLIFRQYINYSSNT